ncbi:ABC transporter substrate-binding protein [Fusibacter sp. 3D3]|uniref:ABC transporter substrate-binding protein n=1 Tax=Fusibacter sp. 3D3 TaxID=1048380 RepID=UPI0008528E54|nr:ABC transporter substrate-binding protein [Fusibacter sp. 3D3]GAU76671.1 extracellular solute-binding protein, family 5 [Fusibacter sp. 3D3]
MKKLLILMLIMTMITAGCSSQNDSKSNEPAGDAGANAVQEGTPDNTATDVVSTDAGKYVLNESPELAKMVNAGTLPSVADRLPLSEDIMVENVVEVGTYGGSFKFAYPKASWNTGKPIEQGLFRFKEDGSVEPNVAKGYEVNEDATVYTIHLREGMKWSDGVDFTAADSVFFYEHMCLTESFGKSLWDCFKVDNPSTGEETHAVFKQVDDYTFTVTFEFSKPSFIENVAINAKWLYAPKHYHETILTEFVGEEKALEKATEMGFSDIKAMGKETGYYYWNVPGVPTLNPYVLSTEKGKSDTNGDYYEYIRNPYYWKTDQAGNQLPYVDKIEYTKITDESQNLLKLLAGDISIGLAEWKDIETVNENADKVGYTINQWANSPWSDVASQLQLNQTAQDDDLRKLFQDKRFREALSISVDREEYSKLISNGWAEPTQASPGEGMLGYSEAWAKKWTDYSPEKAAQLLEEIGLVKGSKGYYTFTDGKELVLNITSYTGSGADDTYVVLKKYFDAVGIKTTYQPVDKDLLNNRLTSNDFEVVLGPVPPAETINIMLLPDTLVPVRNYAAWYGQIGTWYASNGKEGYKPEGDLLELCQLYDQLKATANAEQRTEIAKKMLKLHEDNTWVIGYMSSAATLWTVDKNIHNFKEVSVYSDEFRGLGIAHIDTCFFAQ